MKTLEQIKNEYSVSVGFETWESLIIDHFHDGFHVIDMLIEHEREVMKIYAMECLKLASENAEADHHPIHIEWDPVVIKGSITNENNIIK